MDLRPFSASSGTWADDALRGPSRAILGSATVTGKQIDIGLSRVAITDPRSHPSSATSCNNLSTLILVAASHPVYFLR